MKRLLYILMLLPMFANGQSVVNWKKFGYTGSMKFGAGLLGYPNATQAQADSNSFAESCAWLEIGNDTTNRGLLLPRVLSRDSVASPKKGLLIYEITSDLVLVRTASAWDTLNGGSSGGGTVTDSMIFATRYWVGQQGYLTAETDPLSLHLTDTATLLANYFRTAGYGLISSGHTVRADTGATGLATQYDLTQINTTPYTAGAGIGIVGTVISNTGVVTEVDPIFTSSDAFGVTNSLIANWNAAYNDKVNSLAFTGTGTKTLTLTQQDAGTVTNTFADLGADTSIWATQSDLRDTAAAIRADFPTPVGGATYITGGTDISVSGTGVLIDPYVIDYTGAGGTQDLASVTAVGNTTTLNIITTARMDAPTHRVTNPTSYNDITSSATTPRANPLPDKDGKIIVTDGATGNQIWGQNAAGTAQENKTLSAANGASVTNSANSITVGTPFKVYRYSSGTINLISTGNTTIFTTDANKGRFIVQQMIVVITAFNAAAGTVGYNLGFTAATYNDVITGGTMNSATYNNINEYFVGAGATGVAVSVPASTALIYRVTTGATGTTYNAVVHITGFYENE